MTRAFRVTITRKPGLSDPEGATSRKALTDLGFTEVSGVSFGRIITVTLDTADATDGQSSTILPFSLSS